jgi:two-component system cell cycle sensor histidine kinase/response regulator CckA
MSAPIAKLLIVDDEAPQMRALHDTLEAEGYSAVGFTSPAGALAALREQAFDLVITDLTMPEMDGVTFLHAAFEIDPTLVGIVMTGHGTLDTAVQAMRAGALDYILKPFRLSAILPVLGRALAVRRIRRENIELHQAVGMYELSRAIGFALDFDTVLQKVADAAAAQSRVLAVAVLLRGTKGGEELHVAAARGEDADFLLGRRVPFGSALSAWLVRSLDGPSLPEAFLAAPLEGIPGGVSVPMLAGGNLIGILNLAFEHPRRPVAPGQIKALNILASVAAAALESASLLEQVRAADRQYRRLSDHAVDIIFRYDLHPAPRLAYVNEAVMPITGYSPPEFYADPALIVKIVHPEDRALMEMVLHGKYPNGGTAGLRCVHRGGKVVWIEQRAMHVLDRDGRLAAVEGIARDVTDRKHLEEQLRHSQKMEAIGLLAGGVAHDFNNLLTVILGYSEMILLDDELSAPSRDKVDQMKKAGLHAASLTRQLLAFGRRQLVQPRVLDLNGIVESATKILRRIIGEDIDMVAVLEPALGRVKVDADQIEQVLINLAVNARDAMPNGGNLTLETSNVTLGEGSGHAQGAPGRYSMLAVRDTGCGMDAATQSRVFEPFFTTKELGRGTGLGLSIVYGAVKQNGGSISVQSEPGKGTTFTIYLPQTEESHERPEAPVKRSAVAAGSEEILVVDDDAAVRKLIATVLRKGGYRVLEAHDANDALNICRRDGVNAGLVLTDMVMPQMSGPILVGKLKELNPGIRVLYMSGYADDNIVRQGHLDPGAPFIQKPFSSDSLLEKVRETLDQAIGGNAMSSSGR